MRRNALIVITALLVAIIVTMVLLIREPDTIPYHLDRLVHLRARKLPPPDFRDYFRPETLSWYLRGRPSKEEQRESAVQALIRLGYFEQREFALQHRSLDRYFIEQLRAVCQSNLFVRTTYRAFDYDRPAGIIRVTIRKDYMRICENIITELDKNAD